MDDLRRSCRKPGEAEDVGSHLWAEAGFYPYDAVWMSLRADLWRRFLEVRAHLKSETADLLGKIITATGRAADPKLIEAIARLSDEVPVRLTRDPRSNGRARLGQEMLVGLNWSGRLDISIKANEERLVQWLTT